MTDRDEQLLLATSRFEVVRVSPAGLPPRDVIRHPGAVSILPLLGDGRVCLIRNFRASVGQTLIELPAGTLETNELPIETAARELTEETGYTAGVLQQLHEFYLSPGILDERMYLYLATDLKPGATKHQADERIENLITSVGEAVAMVHDSRIQDAKTIIGLLFYERWHRNI